MKYTIMSEKSGASIQLELGQDRRHNLELVSWMKVAEEDEIVKNVFRKVTEFEPNWVNLYKVYGSVNKNAGRKNWNG
jgi:hypothetical protein